MQKSTTSCGSGFSFGGDESWLCKSTIRRSVLMRLFGEAYDLREVTFSLTLKSLFIK